MSNEAPAATPIQITQANLESSTNSDFKEILKVAKSSLGWGQGFDHEEFFRWKHQLNPFGKSRFWKAVSLETNEIVAFRCMMPWRFTRVSSISGESESLLTYRAVDTATLPAFQGKGIFRKLTLAAVEELTKEGADSVVNTPNEKSGPGYIKMGWCDLGKYPMTVSPNKLSSLPKLLVAQKEAAKKSIIPLSATYPNIFPVESPIGRGAIEEIVRGRGDFTRVSEPSSSHSEVKTEISQEYLLWRYALTPFRYYISLQSETHEIKTACFFRLRERNGIRELAISDVFVRDDSSVNLSPIQAISHEFDYSVFAGKIKGLGPLQLRVPGPRVMSRGLDGAPLALQALSLSLGDLESL